MRPLNKLQEYGYSAAVMFALTAVLPTLLGLAWKGRKLLFSAAATALRLKKLRTRLDTARIAERRR